MAWNDKGGGPWGSPPGGNEPRRPPSNGKGPAGKGPNDFEAILRQGQEKLSEWWPGAHGGSMIALLTGAVVVIWLLSGIYRVDPNEQAVVQRFGALARTESLGLHYHLPTPIETVTIVDVTRRNQTEVGSRNSRESTDAGTMLTGDSNIVELGFVIVWQVRDPVKYLFKVADPADVLQRAAESAMREVIGQTDVQLALNEGRGQIETSSAAILQTTLDRYDSGIQIAAIQLQRVDPPAPVVDAFHDVQRARADLEQQRNDAEKYRNDIVPRARGEAQKIIQDAGGYKDKTIAEATGEAAQFVSVLDAYKAARDVTARRMYIETMESILARSRKIIIDPNADGKNGVVPYLPLPGLNAPAAASPPPVSPAKVQ
jgi:membrane protease subunit HflK